MKMRPSEKVTVSPSKATTRFTKSSWESVESFSGRLNTTRSPLPAPPEESLFTNMRSPVFSVGAIESDVM